MYMQNAVSVWSLMGDLPCRTYVNQLVPHFVFQCDRSALEELSGLLGTPTSQLLRASLSESIVLILTCYAGQPSSHGEGGEVEVEGRSVARARDAHSLLVEYLSKEVCNMYTLPLSCYVECVSSVCSTSLCALPL